MTHTSMEWPIKDRTTWEKRIDKILLQVDEILKTGGFIPFRDHLVPPDVDFENFSYYRHKLKGLIDK